MTAKIIAVDFDGCLVQNEYPSIGAAVYHTCFALCEEQRKGARVILWTCRRDEMLAAAVEWCEAHGIFLDAVNENLPEAVTTFGGDTRKIYADEYWDDRAVPMVPPSHSSSRIQALMLVDKERDRQMAKWGEQNHAPQYWVGILGEEYGEYCQAVNETVFDNGELERAKGGAANMITELSHVAAVAVSAIECLLRNESMP